MNHYVYIIKIPDTGEYYYGSRKCVCSPEEDYKYKGSMVTWKPDKSKLVKEILHTNFSTHYDAISKEAELILEHWDDPLNKNFCLPNGTLYKHSPKQWILKKYGIEEGTKRLKESLDNNSGCWKKGSKPWNTGKNLSEEHIENIRKTWHSEKRNDVMQSNDYQYNMSSSQMGKKNPMSGRSVYSIWLAKYGKEIADQKHADWKNKLKGHEPGNKGKVGYNTKITLEIINKVKEMNLNKISTKNISNDINICEGVVTKIINGKYEK